MNDRQQPDDLQRQAWLIEYQVCQAAQDSTSSSYWLVTTIFVGVSAAVLGGIVFGVLASDKLREMLFAAVLLPIEQAQIIFLCLVVMVLAIAMLIIFWFLWHWLFRVHTLAEINYHRMGDIEQNLGMMKSTLVQALDLEYSLKRDTTKRVLTNEQSLALSELKQKLKKVNSFHFWKVWGRYEPPSRGKHFAWIFATMCAVWFIFFLSTLLRLILLY